MQIAYYFLIITNYYDIINYDRSCNMSSLYFPISAFLISLLLLIVFNNRERLHNHETKIYTTMIGVNFLESLTAILIIVVAKLIGTNKLVFALDRLDFALLTLWISFLARYVYIVSVIKQNNMINKILNGSIIVFVFLLFITKFNVINYKDIIDTSGFAPNLVAVFCAVYSIFMVLILIIRIMKKEINKKNVNKYYPLFVFIILISLSLVLRKFWPTMVLEPFMISFINLIMFFTIENPDVKLLEEINKSKDLAEKYNKDKSIFIFNMTKNIKYPLSVINDRVKDLDLSNDDNIKSAVADIKYSTNKITSIINETLNVDSIDVSKIKIFDTKYNAENIFNELSKYTEILLKNKNVTFISNIDKSIPKELYGDSIRLKLVLKTLLDNSVKHTSEGFIELNINYLIQNDVCRLIISLKDSGKGLSVEKIDESLSGKNTDEEYNTLNGINKYIKLMGGNITIDSEVNKGSEITLVLDQRIVDNYTKTDELIKKYQDGNIKKKILLITNDEKELSRYTNKLKLLYDIEIPHNAQRALELIRNKENFDLIIIKEKMEKLDEISILGKLKEIDGFNIKTIVLTEEDNNIVNNNLISSGFSDTINTKLSVSEFIEKINKIII